MATIVGVIYMYQRSRSPVEARKNMLSNGFFALFLAFPGLIRASFASWQCSANLSDTAVDFTVLLADDRESCEDFSHDVLQYLSAFFILVVGLGLPLGSIWLLRRTYAHVAEEEPAPAPEAVPAADCDGVVVRRRERGHEQIRSDARIAWHELAEARPWPG